MKRILAASFILMANMVLFVHAVIPHHHHQNNLCFDTIAAEQTSHEECCSTACDTSKQGHDSEKDSDNCLLSNIVAPYSGELKQTVRTSISSHDLINTVSLFSIPGKDYSSGVLNLHFYLEIVFNDHIPVYHSLASQSFGLRAPPSFC